MRKRFVHYVPALIAVGGGIFFLKFPAVAAVLLAVPLFLLAFIYLNIVWRLHAVSESEVSFRDITVTLRNRDFGNGGIFLHPRDLRKDETLEGEFVVRGADREEDQGVHGPSSGIRRFN